MAELHLLVGETPCWSCGVALVIPAFGVVGWLDEIAQELTDSNALDDMVLLQHVTHLPESAQLAAQAVQSRYGHAFSKSAGCSYYLTQCQCGAAQGDYYLFGPDGPFFPMSAKEAREVLICRLQDIADDAIAGEPIAGTGRVLLRHGTHCQDEEELLLAARTILSPG